MNIYIYIYEYMNIYTYIYIYIYINDGNSDCIIDCTSENNNLLKNDCFDNITDNRKLKSPKKQNICRGYVRYKQYSWQTC